MHKKKLKANKIILSIGVFVSSQIAMGASFNIEEQRNSLEILNILSPIEEISNNSFSDSTLDNFQQIITNRKQAYFDILNLLKNNKFTIAKDKIHFLLKQYPKVSEFNNLQAVLDLLEQNYDSALKGFHKSIDMNQNDIQAHQGLALLYIKSGDLSKAKKYANKSLLINDKSIQAYFLLANIANSENELQEVESILLRAKGNFQGSIDKEIAISKKLVKIYINKNQLEKSLKLVQDINIRYPNNNSALSFLAKTQLFTNHRTEAIQTLTTLIDQDKKDVEHRLLLASVLAEQSENKKQTLKLLDKVTVLAPDNLQALTQKIIILTKLKHFSEALKFVKKFKQVEPDNMQAELLEADIYRAEKKLDRALSKYQKAYEIKPIPKVLYAIIDILVEQEKLSEAIILLDMELKKNPKNLTAHFQLASIYEQQKNTSQTEKHYLAILAEEPNNVLALNNLAWLYYKQNNPKALALAENAYLKAPNSVAIADTYALILVKQGNLKKGIKILKQASDQMPTVFDIQFHLAHACFLNNNHKQAIEILRSIIKPEYIFSEKNAAVDLLKKLEAN